MPRVQQNSFKSGSLQPRMQPLSFRTQRLSQSLEMARYRAVLSGFHILDWLAGAGGFEPAHLGPQRRSPRNAIAPAQRRDRTATQATPSGARLARSHDHLAFYAGMSGRDRSLSCSGPSVVSAGSFRTDRTSKSDGGMCYSPRLRLAGWVTMGVRGQPTNCDKWYFTARWARIRKHQLLEHPLCKYCLERAIVTRDYLRSRRATMS
jgi:hypothetical protein